MNSRTLVVKLTSGADAPERCAQAFTVAATAVASGVEVSLWLTGEASWLALPGRAEEFSLTNRRDAGNNDDHSGMQWFSAMESEEV